MSAHVSPPLPAQRKGVPARKRSRLAGGGERVLKEIQALRALAVGIVIIYHVWPDALPGGFIGVDVFFVISGFLIGSHLLREIEQTGSVRLTMFWVRRIRRILPAAFVVLAVAVIIMLLVGPRTIWASTLTQVGAAAVYVVNWVLAAQSVDYLAAEDPPTIVQHFWSLSVEEQFYIVLPILLVLALWMSRKLFRGPISAKGAAKVVGLVVLVIVSASLIYSLAMTQYAPTIAYFDTFARAWEFGAGVLLGVVAMLWPRWYSGLRDSRMFGGSRVLTAAGLILIVAGAFLITGDEMFPAPLAAIPVVGVLLVIIGGFSERGSLGVVLGARPIQFLGDVSYSAYLWHWLLVIGFASYVGRDPGWLSGSVIITGTIVLAWLSKKLVEDPFRRARVFSRRRWPAYAFAGGGAAVLIAVVTVIALVSAPRLPSAPTDEAGKDCFGAGALLSSAECADPFAVPPSLDLAAAAADLDTQGWCLTWFNQDWLTCGVGDGSADAKGTIAIVGDSYAASYTRAFDSYFAEAGWKVETFTRFGCPGLGMPNPAVSPDNLALENYTTCRVWSERVRDELVSRDDIDAVVYISRPPAAVTNEAEKSLALTADEVAETWSLVADSGKQVFNVRTSPDLSVGAVPTCLAQAATGTVAPCSAPRAEVVLPWVQDEAAVMLGDAVTSIDLTDAFCDAKLCYAVIGGVVVYADERHVSTTYSTSVLDYLGPQILARLPR